MEESNLKLIKKQFKAARNYWKNKKDVKFVFVGKSLCCNKFNQIFYTNQINGNKCCECLNEIRYKIKSKCHHCGKNYKMNLEQKKNGRKFCSIKCAKDAQNKISEERKKIKCDYCNNDFIMSRSQYGSRDLHKNHFCSKKCKDMHQSLLKGDFKRERVKAKNKGCKEFVYTGKCTICNKTNQKFKTYTCHKLCINCLRTKWRQKKAASLKNNINSKLSHYLRKRLTTHINRLKIIKKGDAIKFSDLVGCTKEHLISHIESKFTPKMSWDNYGTYWHIDHIIPISSFDLSDQDQRKAANHWTNLQPLEASKNIAKSNKMINPQPQLMLQC